MHQTWEIETQNLGFTQMASHGGVEGQNILLILAPVCFLWINLWSVCLYVMGPFSGWWRQGGKGKPPHLKMDVRNRCSPIHSSNRFTFKLHILHNSDNIAYWVFAYRRCDKPENAHFIKGCKKYAAPFDASLTHWGWDKTPAIFQATFSNAFSWMEMYKFRLRFHWYLFTRVQLIVFQYWFRDNDLELSRWQAIISTNDG